MNTPFVFSDLIKRYEDQVERLQFELAESKIERQTILEKYNEAKQQLQVNICLNFRLRYDPQATF